MTVREVALRVLVYHDLMREQFSGWEHLAADRSMLPAVVLDERDWAVLHAIKNFEVQPAVLGATLELLSVYDPERLEVLCHVLNHKPPDAPLPYWMADVLKRWDAVRNEIGDSSYLLRRADQPPDPELQDALAAVMEACPDGTPFEKMEMFAAYARAAFASVLQGFEGYAVE